MPSKGEEKRNYVRVLLDIPCKFSSVDYPTDNADGKIVNLSVGGFAVETNNEVNLGENLKFDVSLPNGFECGFSGQIVREMGNNRYGLKLTQINMLDRMKLGDFIMSQLEEQNYLIKKFLQRKDAEN
jgi:hypothetical protein